MKFLFLLFVLCILSGCRLKDNNFNSFNLSEISQNDLVYFYEVGFYLGKRIQKWESDIRLDVKGEYTDEDLKHIKKTVAILDSLIPNLEISYSTRNPNLIIDFSNPPTSKGVTGMTVIYKAFLKQNTDRALIWISPWPPVYERKRTIDHEIAHAMGFSHSKETYNETNLMAIFLFNSIDVWETSKTNYKFPRIDMEALKILYRSDIPNGLLKSDFEKYLMINDIPFKNPKE